MSWDEFADQLAQLIAKLNKPKYSRLESEVSKVLARAVESRDVTFGPDHELGGRALELRIQELFRELGWPCTQGEPGREDGVVAAPSYARRQKPLVYEVKSGKSPGPGRDELRQLDDWVFEASREGHARKHGLGGGMDAMALVTRGMISSPRFHPTPHKGVMIYNGPIGTPFGERARSWVHANEIGFAERRDFCLISFGTFLQWHRYASDDNDRLAEFWEEIHNTAGVLRDP